MQGVISGDLNFKGVFVGRDISISIRNAFFNDDFNFKRVQRVSFLD